MLSANSVTKIIRPECPESSDLVNPEYHIDFMCQVCYVRDKITTNKIRIMETKDKVLATMKEAGTPLNAGKIAELSGIDRKEVDKAMKQLKEEGAIVSPVRCKWAPAE